MRPIHWVLVLIVVLVLFGAQKLPELARSLGQSAKILKKEMNELTQDDASSASADTTPTQESSEHTPSQER